MSFISFSRFVLPVVLLTTLSAQSYAQGPDALSSRRAHSHYLFSAPAKHETQSIESIPLEIQSARQELENELAEIDLEVLPHKGMLKQEGLAIEPLSPIVLLPEKKIPQKSENLLIDLFIADNGSADIRTPLIKDNESVKAPSTLALALNPMP